MWPNPPAAAFNPAKQLMEQVIETCLIHGLMTKSEAEARAVALFRKLGLPNPETIGRRYPHQVSGGQLQRVMTAMALCPKPDLVVFDEPTTALDVTTQIEVLAAIKEAIRDTGVAAIYITHDLAVVAQVADRHHGPAPRQAGRMGRDAADHPGTEAGALHATSSSPCARIDHQEKTPGEKPLLSVRQTVTAALWRRHRRRPEERHGRSSIPARRSRSSANPAPASPRWRAPSPACCRRGRAPSPSPGAPVAREARQPHPRTICASCR
jgi:hypothetical protein